MANLAIKGHLTRVSEVIALLEMLGGNNKYNLRGNEDEWFVLNGELIQRSDRLFAEKGFTLEEFLEKYPYKVGDKVLAYYEGVFAQFTVKDMRWNYELNRVEYKICSSWCDTSLMQPYKEETLEVTEEFYNKYCVSCGSQRCTRSGEWLEGCEYYKKEKDLDWHPTDYLEFENNDDTWADEVEVNLGNNYEIQVRDSKTFIVRKKTQYPKTYKECCDVLKIPNDERYVDIDVPLSYNKTLKIFTQLLICRDSYWKIAGEQMSLGKPFEPDTCQIVYSIGRYSNEIVSHNDTYGGLFILEFPTAEMRDTFYNNFKDLIEECKELL